MSRVGEDLCLGALSFCTYYVVSGGQVYWFLFVHRMLIVYWFLIVHTA